MLMPVLVRLFGHMLQLQQVNYAKPDKALHAWVLDPFNCLVAFYFFSHSRCLRIASFISVDNFRSSTS
jgi:hypothetical protein